MTPLHLFTKTQRINLSNRIAQQLAGKLIGSRSFAKALDLLFYLMQTPSNSMDFLNKPVLTTVEQQSQSKTWVVKIAAWLDETAQSDDMDLRAILQDEVDDVDVQAIIKLKQLTSQLLE